MLRTPARRHNVSNARLMFLGSAALTDRNSTRATVNYAPAVENTTMARLETPGSMTPLHGRCVSAPAASWLPRP